MAQRKAAPKPITPATLVALAFFGLFFVTGCAQKAVPPPEVQHTRIQPSPASQKAAAIIRTARTMIGAPYKWGGDSPGRGFDCSGLAWYVYRRNGVILPRVSWQQFGAGRAIKYGDIRPGDLIFHKVKKNGKSLHVGIVTDRGTFIHAPSSGKRVMESSLNNTFWRSHYLGARRVL